MVTFYYSDFQIKFIQEVFTKNSHFCEESFFNFLNGNEIDDPEHQVTYSSNNIQISNTKGDVRDSDGKSQTTSKEQRLLTIVRKKNIEIQ